MIFLPGIKNPFSNPKYFPVIPPVWNEKVGGKNWLLKIIPIFLFFSQFLIPSGITADTPTLLRLDLEPQDVLIVEKSQDITIHEPGNIVTKEEKNRIVLKVTEKKETSKVLEGDFFTYSRIPAGSGDYRQDQTFHSRFSMKESGAYIVPQEYYMPNLRSLPTFPASALKDGQKWEEGAEEVMIFNKIRIDIPFNVKYELTGLSDLNIEGVPEGKYHRIKFNYKYDHYVKEKKTPVIRIQGESESTLYFDSNKGIPVYDRSKIHYTFTTQSGADVKYFYDIDSFYKKIRHSNDEQKTAAAAIIEKDLKGNDEIHVRTDREGVILELEDILFDTNSSKLNVRSRKALESVAGVLKKHPGREIRIMGHTDSRGSDEYNRTLSEIRAKNVLETLSKDHGIESSRMSYRGFGEKKPIASNETEDGRSKNRRVEIMIVME